MRLKVFVAVVSAVITIVAVEVGLRLHASANDPARVDVASSLESSRRAGLPTSQRTSSLLGLVRPSRDPRQIYELKPNLNGSFLGARIRTNRFGMRGPDVAMTKPPGARRIVGIGDSVMFGWGVEEDESYMGILDRRLRERDPVTEVLNLAVPGYNTAMEVARLQELGLRFDPDLVILHVVSNDFGLPRFLLEPRAVWRFDRLFLVELARGALGSDRDGRWLQPSDLAQLSEDERRRVDERYRDLEGESAFRNAVARLAELSGTQDVDVLVVVSSCAGDMWSTVCESAQGHGLPVLDVGDGFGRYLKTSDYPSTAAGWKRAFWLSGSDPHPNATAHRLYADAILDWLGDLPVAASHGRSHDRRRSAVRRARPLSDVVSSRGPVVSWPPSSVEVESPPSFQRRWSAFCSEASLMRRSLLLR